MDYAVEMASGCRMCIPSFMKTGTVIQAIFRFRLNIFRGYNIGITDERDL
jgi:hypothetical protein